MEFETVVLESNVVEEMDLGDAGEAYRSYPEARARLQSKLAEYQGLLDSLTTMSCELITSQTKNKVDTVAQEAERAARECLEMKGILSRKQEALLAESRELAAELAYHDGRPGQVDEVEQVRSLIEASSQMRNRGELLNAIECACDARRYLAGCLARVNLEWTQQHQVRIDRLQKSSWTWAQEKGG